MEEIGRRLQAARLAKGLSLQDVEDETRIRKKYIEALENGRPALIPGEVYARGFLKTYGKHLGLDGDALVEEYKQLLQADQLPPEGSKAAEPKPAAEPVRRPPVDGGQSVAPRRASEEPARQADVPVRRETESPARRATEASVRREPRPRTSAAPALPVRGIAIGAAVLLPVVGLIWWFAGREPAPPAPPKAPLAQPQPAPAPAPTPAPAPAPAKTVVTMTPPKGEAVAFTVSASPVVVQMEGFREGFPWMAATVDGKDLFSGKPAGTVKYEGKTVILRVGYMDGVDLVINGERFAQPLKKGPYTITITGH